MLYHILMENKRTDIINALREFNWAIIRPSEAGYIIETEFPDICQCIADNFNYQLVFVDPDNYSKQLVITNSNISYENKV